MKLEYIKCGDYLIPNLTIPEEKRPIGCWGRLHRRYLEDTRPALYTDMVLTCKLWTYLADLNEQAEMRLNTIIEQMKAAEGVTETLKANEQMVWVAKMNGIRNRAEEIILHEIIYADYSERSE